jgi:hypothetical protein
VIEKDELPLKLVQFLKVNPAKAEPWKGIRPRNTPGQVPAGAPGFTAQGTADATVNPAITKRFGEALCAQSVRVSFMESSRSHFRSARQRECSSQLEERPLPRRTGTVALRTVAPTE